MATTAPRFPGQAFKQARLARKITVKEFSKRTGYIQDTVHTIENEVK